MIASINGNAPWLIKAFDRNIYEIEKYDVCSGICPDKCYDKRPREWTKYALNTSTEATELYMVEGITKFYF